MKEFRLEENLGHLTLEQFFELFFEGDTFSYQWHEKRGNTDIHLGPWTKAPDGNRKQRLIRFTPPPAAHPMLKRFTSNTKFKEVLHFHITPNGEAIATAVTMGEGGSSVDLETRVEWTARIDDKDGTLVCTIVGKDEYKRKLFKEMMENFMRESTEANMGLWVELVRRHLHHMGFTSPLPVHKASLVSHPSSSWEDEAGEESDEHSETPAVPNAQVQKRGHDGNHVGVVTVPHVRTEEVEDSDEDEDDDARFVDAREVMLLGEHGVSTAEEVVVLRAAVKGLEREVSNMERQLSKALTRVAGLQQTIQEVTGDSAALSLSLPSLHQRLTALEHAQASAAAAAAAEQAAVLSTLPAAPNGVLPPTPDELEQAVRDIEIERRVSRRNGRKSRASLNRSGLASSSSSSPSPLAPLPPPAPTNTIDTQLPPAAMNVASSGSVPPPPPPLSSPALPAKRRKLMWAGVATLVVLSISLALPLLAPRSTLLDRLLRPLRSLSFWPFSLSFSRSIDAAPSSASK